MNSFLETADDGLVMAMLSLDNSPQIDKRTFNLQDFHSL
jgi:hypothetical protein